MKDHARKADQDDLDSAHLIDAAAGPIHVLHTDANARDGSRELAKLHAQLSPDVRPVVLFELDSNHADVSRNQRRIPASGHPLQLGLDGYDLSARDFAKPHDRQASTLHATAIDDDSVACRIREQARHPLRALGSTTRRVRPQWHAAPGRFGSAGIHRPETAAFDEVGPLTLQTETMPFQGAGDRRWA